MNDTFNSNLKFWEVAWFKLDAFPSKVVLLMHTAIWPYNSVFYFNVFLAVQNFAVCLYAFACLASHSSISKANSSYWCSRQMMITFRQPFGFIPSVFNWLVYCKKFEATEERYYRLNSYKLQLSHDSLLNTTLTDLTSENSIHGCVWVGTQARPINLILKILLVVSF